MLNVLSVLIGLVALVLAIPSLVPFFGWGNWVVVVIAALGAGVGALSRSNGGMKFCVVVFAIACLRLMLGGGFF